MGSRARRCALRLSLSLSLSLSLINRFPHSPTRPAHKGQHRAHRRVVVEPPDDGEAVARVQNCSQLDLGFALPQSRQLVGRGDAAAEERHLGVPVGRGGGGIGVGGGGGGRSEAEASAAAGRCGQGRGERAGRASGGAGARPGSGRGRCPHGAWVGAGEWECLSRAQGRGTPREGKRKSASSERPSLARSQKRQVSTFAFPPPTHTACPTRHNHTQRARACHLHSPPPPTRALPLLSLD